MSFNKKLFDLLNTAKNSIVYIFKLGWDGVDLVATDAKNFVEERVILVAILEDYVALAHLHELPVAWYYFDLFVVKIKPYNFFLRHKLFK